MPFLHEIQNSQELNKEFFTVVGNYSSLVAGEGVKIKIWLQVL